MDKEQEYKKIMEILDNSIVVDQSGSDDNLGKDLQEIAKQLTDDKNTFRFSNQSKRIIFEDSLLGAIGDIPVYDKKIKPRYAFVNSFRKHYHIGRASLKSGQADRYKDIAGSLLGFKGMLEYREAGVQGEDTKKSSIVDRIKKG